MTPTTKNVIMCLAVLALPLILVLVLGMVVVGTEYPGFLAGPPPNAACPFCGARFHVSYHRSQTAMAMRPARCPDCGARATEMDFAVTAYYANGGE